jgi:hypothetical protein
LGLADDDRTLVAETAYLGGTSIQRRSAICSANNAMKNQERIKIRSNRVIRRSLSEIIYKALPASTDALDSDDEPAF